MNQIKANESYQAGKMKNRINMELCPLMVIRSCCLTSNEHDSQHTVINIRDMKLCTICKERQHIGQ